jgi:hypothetical protein
MMLSGRNSSPSRQSAGHRHCGDRPDPHTAAARTFHRSDSGQRGPAGRSPAAAGDTWAARDWYGWVCSVRSAPSQVAPGIPERGRARSSTQAAVLSQQRPVMPAVSLVSLGVPLAAAGQRRHQSARQALFRATQLLEWNAAAMIRTPDAGAIGLPCPRQPGRHRLVPNRRPELMELAAARLAQEPAR